MDNQQHFVCPKPKPKDFIPVMGEVGRNWWAQALTPIERKAVQALINEADILVVEGNSYLLAPINQEIIDVLSAFEADAEDFEFDQDDEPGTDQEGVI